LGTAASSKPKKRLLALIVSYASVLMRVRLERLEPGSLKAMWLREGV
jgi:hypothetical protein